MEQWTTGWRAFTLLFLIACLVFSPLYNAGFVTDFLGWLECRETTPFWSAYECFGNRGLYFVPFVVLEFLTSIFSLHPLPWFLAWIGMHSLNAFLITDVVRRLTKSFSIQISGVVPLIAAIIFLLHPWQVEVLAWKACVNYLFSCFWMLLIIRLIVKWRNSGRWSYYLISLGVYLAFLFTLEFAILFPALVAILIWQLSRNFGLRERTRITFFAMVPYLALIGIWLLTNKALIGVWIGHYGSDTHLSLNIQAMGSALCKYLVKIFVFSRFFEFNTQSTIYSVLDNRIVGSLMAVVVIGLLFSLISPRKPNRSLLCWLFFGGLVSLVPVTNLYFYYLQYSENDRYTYLALAFFTSWLAILLWRRHWLWKGILLLYLGTCIWGTFKLVHTWKQSTKVYWSMLESFPEVSADNVFLLNVPDNFKGTFMFRSIGREAALDECLDMIMDRPVSGKVYEILQYNMTSVDNDFTTNWESDRALKVEFAQWGNWWWRNGIGATNYENELYSVTPSGKSYTVEFKHSLEDAAILLYKPGGWEIIAPPSPSN